MPNAVTKKAPKAKKESKTVPKAKQCSEKGCKKEVSSYGYCRFHYISNWKHIQFNEKSKAERRLNAYVDRMAKRFPKDFLEKIKETLENEEKFKEMAQELEIEMENGPRETDDEFLERFLRTIKPK